MSPYVTSGSFYVPSQYHFHMETQVSDVFCDILVSVCTSMRTSLNDFVLFILPLYRNIIKNINSSPFACNCSLNPANRSQSINQQ